MTCYDVITFRRLPMTLPKDGRKLDQNEIKSIKNAVEEAGIPQFIQIKWKVLLNILFNKQGHKNKCHKGGCDPPFFVPYYGGSQPSLYDRHQSSPSCYGT